MFCPKCGKEIPDGNKFCGVCGFKTDGILDGKTVNTAQKVSEKPKKIIPVFLIVICMTFVIALAFCPMLKLDYEYNYETKEVAAFSMLNTNGERDYVDALWRLASSGKAAFAFALMVTAGALLLVYLEKYLIGFFVTLVYIPIVWAFGYEIYSVSEGLYSAYSLRPTFFMFFIVFNMIAIVMYSLFSAIALRNMKESE